MPKPVLVGLVSKVNHPVMVTIKSTGEKFRLSHKQRTKKEFVEANLVFDPSEVMIIR